MLLRNRIDHFKDHELRVNKFKTYNDVYRKYNNILYRMEKCNMIL